MTGLWGILCDSVMLMANNWMLRWIKTFAKAIYHVYYNHLLCEITNTFLWPYNEIDIFSVAQLLHKTCLALEHSWGVGDWSTISVPFAENGKYVFMKRTHFRPGYEALLESQFYNMNGTCLEMYYNIMAENGTALIVSVRSEVASQQYRYRK